MNHVIPSPAIRAKYRGNAINDFDAYLQCRANIERGFHPAHFLSLKRYYRRAFLNSPFRKGMAHA